jgi:hypothetical protein
MVIHSAIDCLITSKTKLAIVLRSFTQAARAAKAESALATIFLPTNFWLAKKPVDFERLIKGLPKPVIHHAN